MTTVSEEKEVQEELPESAEPENLRRQGRTCASSVTPEEVPDPTAVTQRVGRNAKERASAFAQTVKTSRVVTKANVVGRKAAAAANEGDSLLHSQPPTFAQAWQHHKEHVHRHDGWWWTIPRHLWALVHIGVIKPLLNLVEWITARPAWTLILLAIVLVLKFRG